MIGTSDFETLAAGDGRPPGLSVEAISDLQKRVKAHQGVRMVNAAVIGDHVGQVAVSAHGEMPGIHSVERKPLGIPTLPRRFKSQGRNTEQDTACKAESLSGGREDKRRVSH